MRDWATLLDPAVHQRSRVVLLVQQVEAAFEAWARLRRTAEGRRFALAMILFTRNRRT